MMRKTLVILRRKEDLQAPLFLDLAAKALTQADELAGYVSTFNLLSDPCTSSAQRCTSVAWGVHGLTHRS